MPLRQREQRFLAGVDEADGPARLEGQQARVDLRGDVVLTAEAAADRRLDHAHAIHRQANVRRDLTPIAKRILRGRDDGQDAEVVDVRQPGLRLHRHVVHRLRPVGLLDDDVRLREAFGDVALADGRVLEEVVVAVDERRVRRQRGLDREHARQRLVVDDDAFDRGLGLFLGFRGDERDRVAHAAHLALREYALIENGDAVQVGPGHVLVREHGVHPRHGQCGARVDPLDQRVRVRAPQNLPVEHPGHRHVAGVLELARGLLPGIEARRRRADQTFGRAGFDGCAHAILRIGAGSVVASTSRAADCTAAMILL